MTVTLKHFAEALDARSKPVAAIVWDLAPTVVFDGTLALDHEEVLRNWMCRVGCSRVDYPDRRQVVGAVVSRLFDLVAADLAEPIVPQVNDTDDDETIDLTETITEETTDGGSIDNSV